MKFSLGLEVIPYFLVVFVIVQVLIAKYTRYKQISDASDKITNLTAKNSKLKMNLRSLMLDANTEIATIISESEELQFQFQGNLTEMARINFEDEMFFVKYFHNLTAVYENLYKIAQTELIPLNLGGKNFEPLQGEQTLEKKYDYLYHNHHAILFLTLEIFETTKDLQHQIRVLQMYLRRGKFKRASKLSVSNYSLPRVDYLRTLFSKEKDSVEVHKPQVLDYVQPIGAAG